MTNKYPDSQVFRDSDKQNTCIKESKVGLNSIIQKQGIQHSGSITVIDALKAEKSQPNQSTRHPGILKAS